jgi:hypothetical protein
MLHPEVLMKTDDFWVVVRPLGQPAKTLIAETVAGAERGFPTALKVTPGRKVGKATPSRPVKLVMSVLFTML